MKKAFLVPALSLVVVCGAYASTNGTLFLQGRTLLSPDKIIQEAACGTALTWRIVEKDKAVGSFFSTGPKPRHPRIVEYREINLTDGNATLVFDPSHIANSQSSGQFPTGAPFLKMFIIDNETIRPGSQNKVWYAMRVPVSIFSISDVRAAVECLNSQKTKFEGLIAEKNGPTYIGWVMSEDDSIEINRDSGAPAFTCADGRIAVTLDQFLQFRPFEHVGTIGLDGNIYKSNGPVIDDTQPRVLLPDIRCINSKGEDLQQYLSSIPSRIEILR